MRVNTYGNSVINLFMAFTVLMKKLTIYIYENTFLLLSIHAISN